MATAEKASTPPTESPFPLTFDWNRPLHPWHASYPAGVPRGLAFPEWRVERLLLQAVDCYPDRAALHYFRTRWTYRELLSRVQTAAANLLRLGVRTGDRVLLVLPNGPDFVVAWFALHWLGAEVVPANPLLSACDLELLARSAGVRAVIGLDLRLDPVCSLTRCRTIPLVVVSSLADHLPWYWSWPYRMRVSRNRRCWGPRTQVCGFDRLYESGVPPLTEPASDDGRLPAVLQPTGGTTGSPKIAVLTHRNLLANVAQLHAWCGFAPGEETVLAVLPFFHVFGATVALLSSIAGGATLLLQARFDPARVFGLMRRYRPGVAPLVPFMFAALCREMRRRGRNVSGLRSCFSGASALDPALKAEFEQRTGATIFEGYGLSEASPVTHTNPPGDGARAGSIGLPLPDTEARIVDPADGLTPRSVGEVGELLIRGPQVMAGYLENPAETAQMLRDGWLYTGDLARMDHRGFFTLVDRKKDMIITGGLNVFPTQIEQVLARHPAVSECAVVGRSHPLYGEEVTALVVLRRGASADAQALQRFCRERMAAYKAPRAIEFHAELPKNFLGKVRRVALRDRAA